MIHDPSSLRVALLAGGTGGEREISLASGAASAEALREAGYAVTQLDPAHPEDLKFLIDGPFDVAFLCLHGRGGEDGTIQGMLELLGLPYTGSGVWASATAIDKAKSKGSYQRANIPTPPSLALYAAEANAPKTVTVAGKALFPHAADALDAASHHSGRSEEPSRPQQPNGCGGKESKAHDAMREFATRNGWPLVVKPAREGSALGVFIVNSEEEAREALESAFELDSCVLVERYIQGKEITVAVLGNEAPEALPVIEIVPKNSFYDFEAKYAPGGSQHLCPAPLAPELTQRAQELAVAAHCALECRGMSRTDMILDEAGEVWVLETNTIPGMTGTSLLPDAARQLGMSLSELCMKLIEYALE